MRGATEAIRAEKLVKAFGKITALAGVSLDVAWGETLGILGDNGAGKSTLIKILTGYHQPDSGQVFVAGRPVQLASVDDARALGIECVYQDLALVNGLSIYHNMFLNRELLRRGPLRLLDHREMRRRAAEALDEIGVDVPSVELAVGALSGGQRQAIAAARARRHRYRHDRPQLCADLGDLRPRDTDAARRGHLRERHRRHLGRAAS